MNKKLRYTLFGALLTAWFGVGSVSPLQAAMDLDLGVVYHTWNSNFQAEGYETLLPLSFMYRSHNGLFQVSASTAFVQGHYESKDLGFGGSEFKGNRLTDSTIGLGLAAPVGSFDSALAVQANLPTGDKRWENLSSPSYVPVAFESSLYRGRGFGLSGIYGLSKNLGGHWNAMLSGGYLYSSAVDSGLEWGKIQPGSYALVGAALTRRTDSTLFRLKATQYLAQNTKAGDDSIYRAPSDMVLALKLETGTSVRFLLDTTYSFYGKAKILEPEVGLITEDEASLGNRFQIHPALEYGMGSKLRWTTGATLKVALANNYPTTDNLYNGGGTLVGIEQGLKWLMGKSVFTKYSVSYNRITSFDAAYDANGLFTDVTYNDVSFGTGVGYQW
jgi:hypothetical protein